MNKLEIGGGCVRPEWEDINLGNFDLRLMNKLPYEDNSMEKTFSSHCIEHIENRHVEYLLSELKRVMKPGAILRIGCPDADLIYDAYGNKNEAIFAPIRNRSVEIPWVNGETLEERFINCFVSYGLGDGVPNVHPEKVKKMYEILPKEEFLNWTLCHIDRSRPYIAHVNWFNFDKLHKMLVDAGFVNMERSEYCGSKDEELKNEFDLYPEISLFVECYK